MEQTRRPSYTITDVQAMSGYKPADVADVALKAIDSYTLDELKSDEPLPARIIGNVSVLPKRSGRTRIVMLCYHNGKFLGSMQIDTAK